MPGTKKQVAQEPFEILKQAARQVVGTENLRVQKPQEVAQPQRPEPAYSQPEEKIKEKDTRLIEALEKEIEDIRAQKKMQEQRVKEEPLPRKAPEPLVEPSTKRSRRLFSFGRKTQAERQKTRVEKPLPPSG